MELHVYDSNTFALKFTCDGHEGPVTAVAFHPKMEWLVTSSADKKLNVWRETDGDSSRIRLTSILFAFLCVKCRRPKILHALLQDDSLALIINLLECQANRVSEFKK